MNLNWNPETTEKALHSMLRTLAEEYPLTETKNGVNLVFERADDPEILRVTRRDDIWVVMYGQLSSAARGVAYVLSGQECNERVFLKTRGILFDCTRGNVITVAWFKRWLRRLAMMGYNMAMIYTKDAYQLPGEPYFGYMRGAYSKEEIREMDRYAQQLNIEMIGSVQTLGHLEPILRWPAYGKVRDTADVLMVDKPETYELIDKILTFWSDALSSRRIHIGMDETQSLGTGNFMSEHGYEPPLKIYTRHLNKVMEMCRKKDLRPIIWSDMFFRYTNAEHQYHSMTLTTPEECKDLIPKDVQLSYWDYYSRDQRIYERMITNTSAMNGCEPFMASGVWTWQRLWTDYEQTFATVRPCLNACRKLKVKELIYTLWGDDGGYCDFDSAFAGLAWAADYANNTGEDMSRLSKFYEAVFGTPYQLQLACGSLCYTYATPQNPAVKILPASLLWDDPLMGIVWNEFSALKMGLKDILPEGFRNLMGLIEEHRDDANAGDYNYVWNTANVLVQKIELRKRLLHAYEKRDFNTLELINERYIPEILDAIEGLMDAFRVQWKRKFKSYGLELMQIRLAGLCERYRELGRVIEELIHGEIDSIPELEVKHTASGSIPGQYTKIATGGFFI